MARPVAPSEVGRAARRGGDVGQALDQGHHLGVSQSQVPVADVPLLGQEPAAHQCVEVLGGGRGCHTGVPSRLPGRPGTAVQQGQAHIGSGVVREWPCHRGKVDSDVLARTVSRHTPSIASDGSACAEPTAT
ncbi:hypothetical protein GCM10010211_61230 [Streptomyces albospinus]|uniref:Uncharacterized protein n=1 Tax=Streptomyces albospinus TaxID=285515 RepID=A0ABQ2VH73_9ACTN|nr:hypothetical protein GCM10010211_61230 [Streptomyces albospinus]